MIKIHSRYCDNIGLLLVLCVVVSRAATAQQNAESSKADHRTIRTSSEAIAPWLVSSDQGLAIIGAALESRKPTESNADCSNLVHAIYERAGFTYSYSNSSELYQGIKAFRRIIHPQPGDLVVWRGHVGIVISPVQHSFFSAMRSGRGVEFYDSPYWQARGRPRFFRYLKAGSRIQFSGSTRNEYSKLRSSKNAESHDRVPADGNFGATPGDSGVRPVTGTAGRNGDGSASAMVRVDTGVSAGDGRANPPAALSAVEAPQGASLQKSESQTTRDAPNAMDRKGTSTSHKIQGAGDGVWEKTATKPSAGIPFDSVVAPTAPYIPQHRPAFGASNVATKAGHTGARPPATDGLLTNGSRTEPTHWAMSRYVPRPPWSSSSATTSEPSVPRPPARQVPRAAPGYAPPTWQVR